MPVFTACESKFKILIIHQVWRNSDGLLDYFFTLLQNLFQLEFQVCNQVPKNSETLKNHHCNGQLFTLFLSAMNSTITAGHLIFVIVSPISTGPARTYLVKSSFFSSCLPFPSPHFLKIILCNWHFLWEEGALSFSVLIENISIVNIPIIPHLLCERMVSCRQEKSYNLTIAFRVYTITGENNSKNVVCEDLVHDIKIHSYSYWTRL